MGISRALLRLKRTKYSTSESVDKLQYSRKRDNMFQDTEKSLNLTGCSNMETKYLSLVFQTF